MPQNWPLWCLGTQNWKCSTSAWTKSVPLLPFPVGVVRSASVLLPEASKGFRVGLGFSSGYNSAFSAPSSLSSLPGFWSIHLHNCTPILDLVLGRTPFCHRWWARSVAQPWSIYGRLLGLGRSREPEKGPMSVLGSLCRVSFDSVENFFSPFYI